MKLSQAIPEKHQFRIALCGHKAVEVGGACLLLMVQGQLTQATLGHVAIATQTGLLTVFPLVGITLTRYARHFTNRWITAVLVATCAFIADALVHASHYPGAYSEAALTAAGGAILSIIVSYTPVGRHIDGLAEAFSHEK